MTSDEVGGVVFIERLGVLTRPDAIVDAPGLFSREGPHRELTS
jgi:hypothetical protein